MDFGLSEDQVMLQQSIGRFLSERVSITQVRALRDRDCRNDRDIWKALAELGVTGILVPEEHGGDDMSLLDAALVGQALGHAVTPTAYLGSAVMAPIALRSTKMEGATRWLSGIASGELIFGVAFTETFSTREGAGVKLEGGKLTGKSMMAIDASDADYIIVAQGSDRLAVVARGAAGLTTESILTVDATRCTTELVFDGVTPEAVAEDAFAAIARTLDAGRIVLAADTLGACAAMIDQAVEYAGGRRQFNRVIASFQAVKHMCAEMIGELEPARALMWYAAHSFDAAPDEAPLMACHALSLASEIGRPIASTATQVHGGIGWTDEQNLHFWFKRIANARHLLGGPELLRNRAAVLQDLVAS